MFSSELMNEQVHSLKQDFTFASDDLKTFQICKSTLNVSLVK